MKVRPWATARIAARSSVSTAFFTTYPTAPASAAART